MATFTIGSSASTGDTVAGMIQAAWDAAFDAQEAAEDYAGDAVTASKGRISFNHNPYDLQPEYDTTANDTRAEEKLAILDADVNRALGTTIPGNYALYSGLLSQVKDLESIFGEDAHWDADDHVKIISTLSDSFNKEFILGSAASNGSIGGSLSDISEFLMTGLMYEGDSKVPYGLPIAIEEALHNRTNDRESQEMVRAESDIVATFASRGFPMPPGMAMKAMQEVHEKAYANKANTNREIAIDQAKRGVEATQKYIEIFRTVQQQAQDSFMDYVKVCVDAKSRSTDDMNSLIDAVVKLRSSVVGLYNYIDQEKRVFLDETIAEYDLKFKAERIDLDAFRSRIDGQINATISAAQSMGQLAAAALGSQNTMASLAEETITEG